jgi:DNA replication protein DnaC
MAWKNEAMKCSDCGKDFQGRFAIIDGVERFRSDTCPECQEENTRKERRAEAERELQQAIVNRRTAWREEANLPGMFATKTLDGFNKALQPKAFKAISEYPGKGPGSLVLYSPDLYGVGKTHLVCALVNRLLADEVPARLTQYLSIQEMCCPAHFTTEPHLLDRIRGTFSGRGEVEKEWRLRGSSRPVTDEDIYQEMSKVRLLVVDDVGKVRPRDSSFLQGVYYRIIDGRYTAGLPVILTTNLSLAELETHIGGASADRLREMCGGKNFIKLSGKSYRRQE